MSDESQSAVPQIADPETAGPVVEEPALSAKEVEQQEEAKLKSRYPTRALSGPTFLQKRLAKGQKYFDSGDYQMAKQKVPVSIPRPVPPTMEQPTGEAIPTPESVPIRKTSIFQSKLANQAT